MEWILIIYIYAGMLAKGDSVALQAVHGFSSEQACKAAGKAVEPFVKGTAKELEFVCVKK